MWKEAVVVPHLPGGLKKTTKNFILDSRSPGRDLNPGPPEHEAGVTMTRSQCSVHKQVNFSRLGLFEMVLSIKETIVFTSEFNQHWIDTNSKMKLDIRCDYTRSGK
jgi:hypothetical protein